MTEADALGWLAEMFEEPVQNVARGTQRAQIPGWDSLGQLVLMSALDHRFGIRLTPAELASLASVGDVLRILGGHGCLSDDPR